MRKYSIAVGQKRAFSSELIAYLELDRMPIDYQKACFSIERFIDARTIGIVFGYEHRNIPFDMVMACEQTNGYKNA